jgi:hypothetical protein
MTGKRMVVGHDKVSFFVFRVEDSVGDGDFKK